MRKALFASAAVMVLIGAGAAMAASDTVTITAELDELCGIDVQDDPIALEGVGDEVVGEFTFNCNFAGTGETPLSLSFASTEGGVKRIGGSEVADYNIEYGLVSSLASATLLTPLTSSDSSDGANDDSDRTFTVSLAEALEVAGDYSDVLTITITP